MKTKLIASSPTIDGLEGLLNKYFFSENYRINRDNLTIFNLIRPVPDGLRISQKNGRFRLEQL